MIAATTHYKQEAPMLKAETVSNIRRLCDAKGWTKDDFIGFMRAKVGIKEITSSRLYDGDTNMRVDTAVKVALLLGVKSIGDLIEIKSPPKK